MSTHNIDFYEDLTKIIFELSSNMHLISSADHYSISFQPLTIFFFFFFFDCGFTSRPLTIVISLISSCLCTSHLQ